jgi:hypothetical protein
VNGPGVPLSQSGVVRATARAFVCNHMVWNFICGAAVITKNPYLHIEQPTTIDHLMLIITSSPYF